MIKLQNGDFVIAGCGILAAILMVMIRPGKTSASNPDLERKSYENFLRMINSHLSPASLVAVVLGLSVVMYLFLAIAYKTL